MFLHVGAMRTAGWAEAGVTVSCNRTCDGTSCVDNSVIITQPAVNKRCHMMLALLAAMLPALGCCLHISARCFDEHTIPG